MKSTENIGEFQKKRGRKVGYHHQPDERPPRRYSSCSKSQKFLGIYYCQTVGMDDNSDQKHSLRLWRVGTMEGFSPAEAADLQAMEDEVYTLALIEIF